ncbi:hypothetical protein D3C72_1681200 [compost metagenome]
MVTSVLATALRSMAPDSCRCMPVPPMITIHRKAPRVEASMPPSTTWRTVRPREIRAMNMPTNGPQDNHQPQ